MRKRVVVSISLAATAALVWLFAQPAPPAPRDLASLVPEGPLLYLEAKDFGAILRDWNGSPEKKLWLASDNYQVFSRSRLFLKLGQAQKEFEAAAGVPPNMDLLANVAGNGSALALYDIGALQFLYITRLPASQFTAGTLWKTRGRYQPRQSAGLDYFIRTDPATQRVAAFAAVQDYVLLATREDVLAGALSLLAGKPGPTIQREAWYDQAVRAAKQPGELRMALNLEKLTHSPHFQSYWIQQNISDLRQYRSALSDAGRDGDAIYDNRVLLRAAGEASSWNEAAVAELLRIAPDNAGLSRAWASPSAAQALDLIRDKILEPRPGSAPPSKSAPEVALGDGVVGSEQDLETRIDEPALEIDAQPAYDQLRQLLTAASPDAVLVSQSARPRPDGVLVGFDASVALLAPKDWNSAAVRDALVPALSSLWTTGALGVHWVERRAGQRIYYDLDGLSHLALATSGRLLILSTNRETLEAMLAATAKPPASAGARYAVLYRHASELPNYLRLTRLIDVPLNGSNGQNSEPAYFSANLGSLAGALARVDSESILVHDAGATVTQNVTYAFK